MLSLDDVNKELELLAEAEREEQLDLQYEEFLNEMYYYWECDQWERELELYNELG